MRTSLNEIEQIEKYLLGGLNTQDRLLFQAELLLNPQKTENVYWQQKTYILVQAYGRKQLKKDIEAVHQKLFTSPVHQNFRQKILALFR